MIGYEQRNRRRTFTAGDAYHDRQRRRAQATLPADEQFELRNLMSREALFQTAVTLQQQAGDAPGPNGIRLSELTRVELGALAGVLTGRIQRGTYLPGPRRLVPIPKSDGGTRLLRIQDVEDKDVARRLKDTLEPLIDPMFVEASFGFRPRRGAWQLLARLKAHSDRDHRYVLVVCDVRRAFDSVSTDEVLGAITDLLMKTKLGDCSQPIRDDLLTLIATVLRAGNQGRDVGIDTGCPFSPLALNALLHTKYDLLFLEQENKPLWLRQWEGDRYADNLIQLGQDGTEGRKVLEKLGRHFQELNLPLKDDAEVYDLAQGAKAPILGFLATLREGKLVYELSDAALDRLNERLDETHASPDPVVAATAAVAGWVAWIGPALEDGRRQLPQALNALHSHGYREVLPMTELLRLYEASCQRWRAVLKQEERSNSGE